MLPSITASVLATIVAIAVFYLPVLSVYTMMWSAFIFEDVRNNHGAFMTFIHAAPAIAGCLLSLATWLISLRMVIFPIFAASITIPSSVLTAHSVIIGRYEASEAAAYLAATIGTIALIALTRRLFNANTSTTAHATEH